MKLETNRQFPELPIHFLWVAVAVAVAVAVVVFVFVGWHMLEPMRRSRLQSGSLTPR